MKKITLTLCSALLALSVFATHAQAKRCNVNKTYSKTKTMKLVGTTSEKKAKEALRSYLEKEAKQKCASKCGKYKIKAFHLVVTKEKSKETSRKSKVKVRGKATWKCQS